MKLFMVAYDLKRGWIEVERVARERGFFDSFNTQYGDRVVPMGVLFAHDQSTEDVMRRFQRVVRSVRLPESKWPGLLSLFVAEAVRPALEQTPSRGGNTTRTLLPYVPRHRRTHQRSHTPKP